MNPCTVPRAPAGLAWPLQALPSAPRGWDVPVTTLCWQGLALPLPHGKHARGGNQALPGLGPGTRCAFHRVTRGCWNSPLSAALRAERSCAHKGGLHPLHPCQSSEPRPGSKTLQGLLALPPTRLVLPVAPLPVYPAWPSMARTGGAQRGCSVVSALMECVTFGGAGRTGELVLERTRERERRRWGGDESLRRLICLRRWRSSVCPRTDPMVPLLGPGGPRPARSAHPTAPHHPRCRPNYDPAPPAAPPCTPQSENLPAHAQCLCLLSLRAKLPPTLP